MGARQLAINKYHEAVFSVFLRKEVEERGGNGGTPFSPTRRRECYVSRVPCVAIRPTETVQLADFPIIERRKGREMRLECFGCHAVVHERVFVATSYWREANERTNECKGDPTTDRSMGSKAQLQEGISLTERKRPRSESEGGGEMPSVKAQMTKATAQAASSARKERMGCICLSGGNWPATPDEISEHPCCTLRGCCTCIFCSRRHLISPALTQPPFRRENDIRPLWPYRG